MGLGTISELRVALLGLVLAAVVAAFVYTHHAGYEACVKPQKAAEAAQVTQDRTNDKDRIAELEAKLKELGTPKSTGPTPAMRLCVPTRYVSTGPAAPAAQPSKLPDAGSDQGVRGGSTGEVQGEQPGPDVGPLVQLVEDAGMLTGTGYGVLWDWSVKQAQKPH